MKQLATLFFVSLLTPLFSQPKIAEKLTQILDGNGIWQNANITIYEYDELGQEVVQLRGSHDTLTNGWRYWNRVFKEYDHRGNLKKRISQNFDTIQQWHTSYLYLYEHDANSCLAKTDIWSSAPFNEIKFKTFRYVYHENCQRDSMVEIDRWLNMDSTEVKRREEFTNYDYTDNGLTVTIDSGRKIDGTWESDSEITERKYDEAGKLLESTNASQGEYSFKRVYTYYPSEDLKNKMTLKWDNGRWEIEHVMHYDLTFDEKGRAVQQNRYYTFPPSEIRFLPFEKNYEYYCDGLLRTDFDVTSKDIYTYTEPTDCFELKGGKIDALVFPNPATDKINVFSTALQSNDMTVSIYNSNGSMVFRKKMEGRDETFEIDVSGFVTGIYFVNLAGMGATKSVKVFVQH